MIKLDHINVTFDNQSVLRNLSSVVHEGDFITIIGANGTGKTTLFDVIAGRVKPSAGSIEIDGIDVTQSDERERSIMIARLFQNPSINVVPSLTVAQNLLLAWKKGQRMSFQRASTTLNDEIKNRLALCGGDIEKHLDKPMHALSGGQRQMIALVMATLRIPKILLLDEPTAALDPQAATNLLVFAKKLIEQHRITTLMITHNQQLALALGNKLWILHDGIIEREVGNEKQSLVTHDLIGDIDYKSLN